MKSLNILGVKVDDCGRAEALDLAKKFLIDGDQHYITTPNPEIVLRASERKKLRIIFDNADLSLPDGFGLKIGARLLGQKLENRITGADFMLEICKIAAEQNAPIFLLGGAPATSSVALAKEEGNKSVAKKAGIKLKTLFPSLIIAGTENGGEVIKENCEWHASDINLIDKINASPAKIIFVAFGCPKQEKWIRDNLYKLTTVKLAMAVGGSLDFLAGTRRRAPRAMRKMGLEWLWRLINEPTRLPRIWNATIKFIFKAITWRLRMRSTYRNNVAGFIFNDQNEVLLVWRSNEKNEHWQLPQGGVDKGETSEQAVLREMNEETGAKNLKITGQHPLKHTFEVSPWHKLRTGYKGQRQTLFYLRFSGNNDEIVPGPGEIQNYRWVEMDKVLDTVFHKRREMTKMAVEGFKKYVQAN